MKLKNELTVTSVALLVSGSIMAAVPAEEAGKLGDTLLPWGAIKAGNAEGTIPAYDGNFKPPAAYDPAKPGIRPDPFADEAPRVVITRENLAAHADKLSDGVKAMFDKYPTFRMDVYPSHRIVRYPDWYAQNSIKNATSCTTEEGGLKLKNCYAGVPFPIPQAGIEVMWNRFMKYQNMSLRADDIRTTVVDANGQVIQTAGWRQRLQWPTWNQRTEPLRGDELHELSRTDYTEPARKNGEKLVLNDGLDMASNPRRAWSYLVGQRRVKLAPDVAYDTPTPTGAGIGVVDESEVFFGAFDRYDFKLLGKKEMYIPYNSYKGQDPKKCGPDVVFTKNHLNPDCVRWELHRVWAVEATLKEGKRHVYPRRVIYWDEDMPAAGMTDNYDGTGALYRMTYNASFAFYESEGYNTSEFVVHDLASGAYTRQSHTLAQTGWMVVEPLPESYFSPGAMAGSGVR